MVSCEGSGVGAEGLRCLAREVQEGVRVVAFAPDTSEASAPSIHIRAATQVISGSTSLMIMLSFFLSFNFPILGVLGEYIARVYRQVEKWPHFGIESEMGF